MCDGNETLRILSTPIECPIPSNVNADGVWTELAAKLIDVGVACWEDDIEQHFTDLIQSPGLRAPEVCIGAGWGKSADIWSLGCVVYELVMGKSLVSSTVDEMSVPYLHAVYFGPYPLSMVRAGKYSHLFFNEDGSQLFPQPEHLPLDLAVRKRGPPVDVDGFTDFLNLMLRLDPTERASSQTLLGHRWLAHD